MDNEIVEFLKRKSELQEKNKKLIENTPSIQITRNQTSTETPLKCVLTIELSKFVRNPERIIQIYEYVESNYRHGAEISLKKIDNRLYSICIVSGKYRCSWCENFRKYVKKNMNLNLIETGACSSFNKSEGYKHYKYYK